MYMVYWAGEGTGLWNGVRSNIRVLSSTTTKLLDAADARDDEDDDARYGDHGIHKSSLKSSEGI